MYSLVVDQQEENMAIISSDEKYFLGVFQNRKTPSPVLACLTQPLLPCAPLLVPDQSRPMQQAVPILSVEPSHKIVIRCSHQQEVRAVNTGQRTGRPSSMHDISKYYIYVLYACMDGWMDAWMEIYGNIWKYMKIMSRNEQNI